MPREKKNWVVVELETNGDWGEGGYSEYKSIGRVFGPYTEEAAKATERDMSRRPYSDWEAREMQ